MMKRFTLFLLLIAAPFSAFTAWSPDPTVRNPVATLPGTQSNPRACSDGQGGVIITWLDQYKSVYAKRITKNGTYLWGANGVAIFNPPAPPIGNNPVSADVTAIVADGFGGAIVFYEATIIGGADQIYAERIDALGNLVWANPIKITDLPDSRLRWAEKIEQFGLSADGNGGAFITWQSYGAANGVIFAQHINKDGFLVWGSTGVAMPMIKNRNGYFSSIVNSGNGTAVVAFDDGIYGLYLQRVSSNGTLMWPGNGVQISSNAQFQGQAILAYDANFANPTQPYVAVTFLSPISPTNNNDVFVQKIALNTGNVLWGAGGKNITNTPDTSETDPYVVINKSGKIFMTYGGNSGADNAKVQRINSSNGGLLWGAGGITTNALHLQNPVIADDGVGGIFFMGATPGINGYGLFAQRYNSIGTALWGGNGVTVIQKQVDLNHNVTPLVASTGGRAIAAWADTRISSDENIYAARF